MWERVLGVWEWAQASAAQASVERDEFADGATYISLMEQNANALKEALN